MINNCTAMFARGKLISATRQKSRAAAENFYNYCDFAKDPRRESSARHAVFNNKQKQQDIANESYEAYQIVPNPNNGTFNLLCPDTEEFIYTVYDSKGNKVTEKKAIPNQGIVNFSLNDIATGLYVMVITSANERKSIKFNINH